MLPSTLALSFLTQHALGVGWGWVFGFVFLSPFLGGIRIPPGKLQCLEIWLLSVSNPLQPALALAQPVLSGSRLSSGPAAPVGYLTQLISPMREFWQRQLECKPIFPCNCLYEVLASALETAL